MTWQKIGPYRDAVIWVRALRSGQWVAAITPLTMPPESTPGVASLSGEMILPEGFESQAAAVEAAQTYLDREHERRGEGSGQPAGDQRTQPMSGATGRRRFARFPVSLPVLGQAEQFPEKEIPGTVRNLGAGGLVAEFPVQMLPGTAVSLLLQTRRGPLEVEARVVWTFASGGIVRHGLAFIEPHSRDFAIDVYIGERQ